MSHDLLHSASAAGLADTRSAHRRLNGTRRSLKRRGQPRLIPELTNAQLAELRLQLERLGRGLSSPEEGTRLRKLIREDERVATLWRDLAPLESQGERPTAPDSGSKAPTQAVPGLPAASVRRPIDLNAVFVASGSALVLLALLNLLF